MLIQTVLKLWYGRRQGVWTSPGKKSWVAICFLEEKLVQTSMEKQFDPFPRWNCLGSAQIQDFFSGVGSRPDGQKTVWTTFFFQSYLQFTEGVQYFYYRENNTFPRIQRGSNIFQGVQLFSLGGGGGGGSKRKPYILWFTRGVRIPYPPSGSALVARTHVWWWIFSPCSRFSYHTF